MMVVGVELHGGTFREALKLILGTCLNSGPKENRLVSATGAHGIVYARRNPAFGALLGSFFLNLPDGMPAVWLGRFKGARQMERCYGPELFREVLRESANISIKHFFCGGKSGVADQLLAVCRNSFGNEKCVGTYSPAFGEMTNEELRSLGDTITTSGADILWIGMSTPKQEMFAARLAKFLRVHFIITVGAAFDFHTGRVHQAPRWMQKAGLEWFFRALSEPRRLTRRYMEIVPLFLYYGMLDIIRHLTKRKEK